MTKDVEKSKEKSKWHFLIQLLLALLFFGISLAIYGITKILLKDIGWYETIWGRSFATLIMIILVYIGYKFYLQFFEKRKPTEYSIKYFRSKLTAGMIVGSGLITIQVLFLWLIGIYQISEIKLTEGIVSIFLISIITGFLEELLNKGIIFRLVEKGLGAWIAMVVVAVEVGLTHISNGGATTFSTLAVSLEFGVMLVLFYMVTRRLWFVTGFHFAWNFTLGGIFGINVSGLGVNGLVHSNLNGPEILTGGTFGIEASITAVTISLIITVLLLIYIIKNKLIVSPYGIEN